ncbi:hypothetical protein CWI42_090990 [Ordospora colligata]|uniref:Uncharacterized protein n=1 Tax=Ordospora colligata OC4 TaxID=1354746 RepID=A0A0B2UJE5_9MICR|nr:uncharacterized protein M896_091000 [Ordospora colligata OC4]KHN69172.1 hypothetical protein M896_091000 [Ordospora colligata OC4]TBU14627.1 hypothetical protein CWI41_090990 [Ordospora colligata]TBU18144.1 hypothetical protein CWI42_090990 [Ordospora colligata]
MEKRHFDVRDLFPQSEPNACSEEDDVYAKISKRRNKRHARDAFPIFSTEEMNTLAHIDMESTQIQSDHSPSKITWKHYRSIGLKELDCYEIESSTNACDNKWKISILTDLIQKNRQNVDARIKLSRLLPCDNANKILIDARDIRDARLWTEIIKRCYVPELLNDALNVMNGDEQFYMMLFECDKRIDVLQAGVLKHPKSILLRKAMTNAINCIDQKQCFLYDSVIDMADVYIEADNSKDLSTADNVLDSTASNASNEFAMMFVASQPAIHMIKRLYNQLKCKQIYLHALMVHLLINGDDDVLNDLFCLHLHKIVCILNDCKIKVVFPVETLNNTDIILYIKGVKVDPMCVMPHGLRCLFVSISKHGMHDDESFVLCYGVIKQCVLDEQFIDEFFVMHRRRYFVDLMKAKEYWKLYTMQNELKFFRKADKILKCGVMHYGKEKKLFVLARSKMHYFAGDFVGSLSAIPKKMKTIRRYVVLSQMSVKMAISTIRNDLHEYKHYLLYAELTRNAGMDASEVYEECMRKYPNNVEVAVGYLRYIKVVDVEKAVELSNEMIKKYASDERMWYERFVIFRHSGRIALPVLYNSRKHVRSGLIDSEIKYYENKQVPEGSKYSGYYEYKRMIDMECNTLGICEACIQRMKQYYAHRIENDYDDGDSYLLLYGVLKSVPEEVIKMVKFFDPRNGMYWARVRNVVSAAERLKQGLEVMEFDMIRRSKVN